MPDVQMGGAFDPTRDVALQKGITVTGTGTFTGTLAGPWTVSTVTATGATGSTAQDLGTGWPLVANITGASGAGINLSTGVAAGSYGLIRNAMTGVLKIYSVGGTINGSTGTTAVSLTVTGNSIIHVFNTAAGTWFAVGNT